MKRRDFVRICTSALGLVAVTPALLAEDSRARRLYQRVKLVDGGGAPLKASALKPQAPQLFHYPYAGTPCFLVRLNGSIAGDVPLKTADDRRYVWTGGIGPGHSIVAFSAICPHQLSYSSKHQSFINYQATPSPVAHRADVITCCAHYSVFDPGQGGKVLDGPAPQPLTTILLEHDTGTDELYAIGTLGGELFEDFFNAYRTELIEEFGRGVSHQEATGTTVTLPVEKYAAQIFKC